MNAASAASAASAATDAADRKVAVISGGSRGLGEVLVRHFLDKNYRVATFSRSETPFVRQLSADPRITADFHWELLDIASGDLKGFVYRVWHKFGAIDCLVNNAGIGGDGILATMPSRMLDVVIDCNLRGALNLTKYVVKKMILKSGGNIVNISSVNGIRGHSGLAVYSATKAALDGLTRSLSRELGRKGIRVNSVSPGYFESDMVGGLSEAATASILRRTPLGRLGTPEEVARLVMFITEEAEFITGQTIVIDGGFTC